MIELRLVLVTLAAAGLLAAGCDEDEDGENRDGAPAATVSGAEEAASLQQEIADLSDEEQIERVGEAWAEPFAAGDETMCGYFHRDAASSCTVYVQGGSSKLQKSFAGTTVENVKFTRLIFRAVADFSNGEQVTFSQEPGRAWKVFKILGQDWAKPGALTVSGLRLMLWTPGSRFPCEGALLERSRCLRLARSGRGASFVEHPRRLGSV